VEHTQDKLHQPIEIQRVEVDFKPGKAGKLPAAASDTFYWVRSEAKAAKENGMYDQFTRRFEAELEKVRASLSKKRGTKKADKVLIRIGRAKQKYPSVASHYDIDVTEDKETGNVTAIEWKLKEGYDHNDTAGVYFLQTNLDGNDGTTVWTIYNILKEVEASFRCMKTDLNLRPVFHKGGTTMLITSGRVPGQALPGTPAPGHTGLLGRGHHTLPAQAEGIQQGVDTDSEHHGHAALRRHGDEELTRRHHTHREPDRADRAGQGDLREGRHQPHALQDEKICGGTNFKAKK
jgi:hypothetical protein